MRLKLLLCGELAPVILRRLVKAVVSPQVHSAIQEQVKGTNLPSTSLLSHHPLASYATSASHSFPKPQHVLSHFKRFPSA